ncbi:MAG: hypothetical protein ACR2N7_12250 [Acidimicrobiia bacterium]
MRIAWFIVGLALILMGAVWTLQGMGSEYAPQSFMTGSQIWIVIGLGTIIGGSILAWRHRPWN